MLALAGFWLFNAVMAVWYWNVNGSTTAAKSTNGKSVPVFLPEIATNQLLIYWLLGAMLLGALAYLSRPR